MYIADKTFERRRLRPRGEGIPCFLFCIGCQQTIKETSPYEYSVNDIMSNVAARQRSEKNAMLQGDGQVDHRSNPKRPLRGPEALIDTSPCTLGTGCSIAPRLTATKFLRFWANECKPSIETMRRISNPWILNPSLNYALQTVSHHKDEGVAW